MLKCHFLIIVLKSIEKSLRQTKYYGGYIKVVIVNLIITLYIFCILKIIYFITTKMTDEFPFQINKSAETKEKINLFNKIKECLDKTDMNKKVVIILKEYRAIE